jgi:hypothetical protein
MSNNQLLVFGATGQTGKHLTLMAIEAPSIAKINVYVRSAAKLDPRITSSAKVSVTEGSMNDDALIKKAAIGCNLVYSGLGPVKGSPQDIVFTSVKKIYASLDPSLPSLIKFVHISGGLTHNPATDPRPGVSRKMVIGFGKMLLGSVPIAAQNDAMKFIADNAGKDNQKIQAIGIRPPSLCPLVEGEATGAYKHQKQNSGTASSFRAADMSHFGLALLTDEKLWQEYAGLTPSIHL